METEALNEYERERGDNLTLEPRVEVAKIMPEHQGYVRHAYEVWKMRWDMTKLVLTVSLKAKSNDLEVNVVGSSGGLVGCSEKGHWLNDKAAHISPTQ